MNSVAQLNAALAGRYVVEREIGAGGMATVYLARDVKHQRNVALKVLLPELGAILGVNGSRQRSRSPRTCSIPTCSPCLTRARQTDCSFT